MKKDLQNKPPGEKKNPWRYKLYDHLPLSVGTVNVIIYVLIGLIALAVLAGMQIR